MLRSQGFKSVVSLVAAYGGSAEKPFDGEVEFVASSQTQHRSGTGGRRVNAILCCGGEHGNGEVTRGETAPGPEGKPSLVSEGLAKV